MFALMLFGNPSIYLFCSFWEKNYCFYLLFEDITFEPSTHLQKMVKKLLVLICSTSYPWLCIGSPFYGPSFLQNSRCFIIRILWKSVRFTNGNGQSFYIKRFSFLFLFYTSQFSINQFEFRVSIIPHKCILPHVSSRRFVLSLRISPKLILILWYTPHDKNWFFILIDVVFYVQYLKTFQKPSYQTMINIVKKGGMIRTQGWPT